MKQNQANGKKGDPVLIPQSIGVPLLTLASQMGREPTIGYATSVLDNCVNINENDEEDFPQVKNNN